MNDGNPIKAPERSAVITMPNTAGLGGKNPNMPAWIRAPYYPTAPFMSTDPYVGMQTRYYSALLVSTESDYTVGSGAIRRVPFDIPVRLIAMNGTSVKTDGSALPVGWDPRDTFTIQAEYTQGDKLITNPVLGSTVLGTAQRPGELGGVGWTMNPGGTLLLTITPLVAGLRISIALACLEIRGPTNYNVVGGNIPG